MVDKLGARIASADRLVRRVGRVPGRVLFETLRVLQEMFVE